MSTFLSYYKKSFKIMIQWRWGFAISLLIDPMVLLINISLFTSIYNYNNTQNILGYSLSQMIWYFAGTSFIWYLTYNFTDRNISTGILSGDIAVLLLKPVSIMKVELAEALALRTNGLLFEFIPSLILYSLIYHPDFLSIFSLLRFLTVIIFAFSINFLLNFLIGISAFVIKSNFSLQSLKSAVVGLLAGVFFPIDFFPDFIQNIASYLPFQYIFYVPIQVFLNKSNTNSLEGFMQIILIMLIWTVLLYVLCKVLWSKAVKRFCAVGG